MSQPRHLDRDKEARPRLNTRYSARHRASDAPQHADSDEHREIRVQSLAQRIDTHHRTKDSQKFRAV